MSSRAWSVFALVVAVLASATAVDARPHRNVTMPRQAVSQQVAFMGYLRDGRIATVYADERVVIAPPKATAPGHDPASRRAALLQSLKARRTPARQLRLPAGQYGPLDGDVPAAVRRQILFDLERVPQQYAPGRVVVVFKPGVTVTQDHDALSSAATTSLVRALGAKRRDITPHAFSGDARTNLTLMHLGVDRSDRLFSTIDRGTLGALRSRAEARTKRPMTAIDNAFVLHVSASSVENAVRTLRASSSVAYAAPDFAVSPMLASRRPIPAEVVREISAYQRQTKTFGRSVRSTSARGIPQNSAVTFGLQALLNAPGVDAIAAFDEIGQRFNQLPGTGEIITNVGLGDVDDATAASDPNDPCYSIVQNFGPSTHLIGGQRYLDWPSLPLIPAWVSDSTGALSNTAEVCNVDPNLAEVGLDFSVMAPLPHDQQRAGEIAGIGNDLLGIAPGASYRWVAPGMTNGVVTGTDTLAAMIAAARQVPAPNVMTVSIGFGADVYGFPGRYLEDDPIAQTIVAGIVASNVVVCIAANDGTRLLSGSSVGPSGGSAPTNVGATNQTNLGDVFFTTVPSVIADSGAIDVGATTLDDIFSANPQDPAMAALANVKAFAETRYNGVLGFSSGFGSRVNISAPGDNINALVKVTPTYDGVTTENVAGTSASAPEVAAAAAVALQVARLTGHPYTSAAQVRDALIATGTPVANPPQADVNLNVGPQVSVRRIVEQLLAAAGSTVQPGVARVAVQGRRSGQFIAQNNTNAVNDATFTTALDPSYIKLTGPFTRFSHIHGVTFPGLDTGADLNSYITIAPDWEGIPANATYRLEVTGQPNKVIATTPYVRLLPAQLFAAAGIPLTPGVSRTISMTYRSSVGLHTIAESTFQLTFGPPSAGSRLVPAPAAPPVVSGSTVPVTYDLRGYPSALLNAPVLNVSMPGTGIANFLSVGLVPYYSTPLSGTHGTVNVPVSALAGGGTYAMWIAMQPGATAFNSDISDEAFVRVDAGTARPPAPLLSLTRGGTMVHTLTVPWKTSFFLTYDVSNVPRATGALIEVSAPPPGGPFVGNFFGNGLNTFRNPNGSTIDDDGVVTGSIYHVQANGTSGTVAVDPERATIPATATVNVRIIPTAGSTPVAEASDADMLSYLGIEPQLGGTVNAAYMNPNGSDGYVMESGSTGTPQANVQWFPIEPFDLATGVVAPGFPLTFTSTTTVALPIVQDDVGVFVNAPDETTMQFFRSVPLEAPPAQFTFPQGTFGTSSFLLAAAINSTSTKSAYLAGDFATQAITVARGDITTGAFGAPVDVTALVAPNVDYGGLFGLAYDPGTDRAYLLTEDITRDCEQQSPVFVTIDFTNGSATARTLPIGGGVTEGAGYGFAIDPVTHKAAIATSCQPSVSTGPFAYRSELTLLDLATGNTSRIFQHVMGIDGAVHGWPLMIGGESPVVGIDPVNHVILQRSIFCPERLSTTDLNGRPCLNEYDESGRLTKTIPGLFSNAPSFLVFNGVNGSSRTGIAEGQMPPGPFLRSFDVQPYTY